MSGKLWNGTSIRIFTGIAWTTQIARIIEEEVPRTKDLARGKEEEKGEE